MGLWVGGGSFLIFFSQTGIQAVSQYRLLGHAQVLSSRLGILLEEPRLSNYRKRWSPIPNIAAESYVAQIHVKMILVV